MTGDRTPSSREKTREAAIEAEKAKAKSKEKSE